MSINDDQEVDMNDLLKKKFAEGKGIIQISQGMSDDMILLTIKNTISLANGKAFKVISTLGV